MTRNMIEANKTIFALLDREARQRGEYLANEGLPRWIKTDDADKEILKNFSLTSSFRLAPGRVIARFDRPPDNLFVVLGFDDEVTSSWLLPFEVGAGLFTAVISELQPRPSANSLEIKQLVDAQDGRDPAYEGHPCFAIASLFPRLKAFLGMQIDHSETDKIAFDLILSETELSSNWIDDDLANDLRHLLDLDGLNIPYRMLARSLLDLDPSSLFMALYRCLEALYAHGGATQLRATLGIDQKWDQIAIALEADLGWRPFEARSLESLIQMADVEDLRLICQAIAPAFPGVSGSDPVRSASDLLYKLRNSVVHFRPVHSKINLDLVDWKLLCRSCTAVIWYVYSSVFES